MLGLLAAWILGAPALSSPAGIPSRPVAAIHAPAAIPRAAVAAPPPPPKQPIRPATVVVPKTVSVTSDAPTTKPVPQRIDLTSAPAPVPAIDASNVARHVKARLEKHNSYPERNGGTPVREELASWRRPYPQYTPVEFTSKVVLDNFEGPRVAGPGGAHKDGHAVWADPPSVKDVQHPFHSYTGTVAFDPEGRPLNPMGRTGIAGRGILGKWGANFAADPIIVRRNPKTGQHEMLAIKRKDSGDWAIPGGMVDEGESISTTLARELHEETGVAQRMDDAKILYRGYADDPRNTDHAWMETTVALKVLSPEIAAKMKPRAGDDAGATKWMPLDDANIARLYGNHGEFARLAVAALRNAP